MLDAGRLTRSRTKPEDYLFAIRYYNISNLAICTNRYQETKRRYELEKSPRKWMCATVVLAK